MGSRLANSNPFTALISGEHELNLENAKAVEADAKYNAQQRRIQAEKLTGDQVAAVAVSGIELDGSAMEVIKKDRQEAEIEAMNIRYSGKMRAAFMRRQSALQRDQGYMNLIVSGASMALSSGALRPGAKGTQAKAGMPGNTISDNSSSYGKDNIA